MSHIVFAVTNSASKLDSPLRDVDRALYILGGED